MGKRRLALVHTSDDEDDAPPRDESKNKLKRKKVLLPDDEEDEREELKKPKKRKKKKNDEEEEEEEEEEEPDAETENEEEQEEEKECADAQPLGDVVRVSGKGRGKKNHYGSFQYDDLQYHLEDPVLLSPENCNQKPYVAIIKDIVQTLDGATVLTGQWFYRPEEAEKRGGGNWQSRDTRELFYSFHRDEVPAESVMHKCVVHFIPLNKQIPQRKQHPGFIVQKVYDTEQRRLFKLTDKDYEENKQHELDLLVQKTSVRLGGIPDLETEDTALDHEDHIKNKRLSRRRKIALLDVSREEEGLNRFQSLKAETPGSTTAIGSEYYAILSNFKLLTDELQRDKWLEKLLQSLQFICTPVGSKQNDKEELGGLDLKNISIKNSGSNDISESPDKNSNVDVAFDWPDAAVPAVAALEKAAHDLLSADFQKYNQKMRQLTFNLKGNAVLSRRLLSRELEPARILNMSPNELKEGLTAEEIASREPEESGRMQMTDARCKRCSEKQVGVRDIIQAGHGDRYQLECVACGNTWYASRDDAAATLTIEGPTPAKTKLDDAEKNLVSLSEAADKGAADNALKKTTDAYMPPPPPSPPPPPPPVLLDNQKSFNKTRSELNPAASN
ncbi:hypothetical protein ACJIZ3_008226 [Penstemon smallii]|uniref:Uncharacterized protein n=1 Tax=Penstemon smallii TaxID=265156 RepID=A0ABD3T9V6_9LAMI